MIHSSAPTRIDLAGGTLDLWPLYLFFGNPPTLNAAINLYATVQLKARRDKAIHVESKDLGIKTQFKNLDRLRELRVSHRDLDYLIDRLQHDPMVDQLRIRRLKKRKLLIKDMITNLESELIPDLDA